MSDIALAITRVKALESLLEQLGATGKGLHEKVTSVQDRLSAELVKKLRFIATVRNKLVHDANYSQLDDRDGFVRACDEAAAELRALLAPPRVVNRGCLGLLVLLGGLAMLFVFAGAFTLGGGLPGNRELYPNPAIDR
ncbi:MAG: hypothetical protein RMJ56_17800 [Gemmataceae bacterium]|nr:hypothetical protein [Gemmata sp.]MDW8199453.1 hypothetical protein [Gemmataceae bacterium]